MTGADREDGLCNFQLTVGYDGRRFHGWQRLRGSRTVQGTLEEAAAAAFGIHGPAQGASRTDRGVHAEGQVVSMRLPAGISADAASAQLREELPEDLWLVALAPAAMDFHAREHAVGKDYRYVLFNEEPAPAEWDGRAWSFAAPLELGAMQKAATHLVGQHDFAAFAKRPRTGGGSTVRVLHRCAVEKGASGEVVFSVAGDGFLFRMVRNLVSALVRVGQGRWEVDQVRRLLAVPVRPPGAGTAPPDGLYLDAVHYPDDASPRSERG